VLRIYQYDSPASMSIHEEALNSAQNPIMAVFNNLVAFKQDEPQNRLDTIVPDLATKWSWNADMTELTFRLRHGVNWHDGKPFTAADVKCTWDLILGNGKEKLRANQRRYGNVPSETAAAGLYCAPRLGLLAGLSVPCVAAEHANTSDRHRPVQIRFVQTE
jgi:ABC-type transport system substrate-binding protein